MYWPLPPRTWGSFSMAASSCEASVSARTPSLARSGATTPSFCPTSAWRRCSGSIAWCPRSLASVCADWSASWALIVSLSSLILVPTFLLVRVAARRIGSQRPQTFVQLFLGGRELRRHHDPDRHELVAGTATANPGHAVARESERAAARRGRRNLHRDLPAQRWHLDRRAERRFRGGDRQRYVDVVALAFKLRVRRDRHDKVEITTPAGATAALARNTDLLS